SLSALHEARSKCCSQFGFPPELSPLDSTRESVVAPTVVVAIDILDDPPLESPGASFVLASHDDPRTKRSPKIQRRPHARCCVDSMIVRLFIIVDACEVAHCLH